MLNCTASAEFRINVDRSASVLPVIRSSESAPCPNVCGGLESQRRAAAGSGSTDIPLMIVAGFARDAEASGV